MNRKREADAAAGGSMENDMDGSSLPAGFGGPMAPGDDADIERLLREDAAAQPHIADDGFVVRVLMHMPPPRKAAPNWLVPAAAVVGGAAAAVLTPAGAWLADSLVALLNPRTASLAGLSVLVPVAVFWGLALSALRER